METQPAAPRDLRVHGVLFAVQVAFASLSVAGKVAMDTLEPGALALVRLSGAALVFVLLSLRRPFPRVPLRDVLAIAGCAALGIFGNQLLYLNGLRRTSAVDATVIVATIPVFTVLAAILLGFEKPRGRTLAGVAVAFSGVLFLVGVEAFGTGARSSALGDLLVLANSFAYGLYLVLIRGLVAKHGSLPVVTIGFVAATLFALPIGLADLVQVAPTLRPGVVALLVYLIAVPTIFTYLANAWALRRAPSSLVAIYIYLQPMGAALFAWAFLGDLPTPRVLVAALAVFVGIWLTATRGHVRPRPA